MLLLSASVLFVIAVADGGAHVKNGDGGSGDEGDVGDGENPITTQKGKDNLAST